MACERIYTKEEMTERNHYINELSLDIVKKDRYIKAIEEVQEDLATENRNLKLAIVILLAIIIGLLVA